jgi:hypothetical protein
MEAARTSETLVNFYQITRRCNPEDSNLREKLKSYWTTINDKTHHRWIAHSQGDVMIQTAMKFKKSEL